ncbi:hypothetical protein [Streptococcus pluranimalium]|uniref:hypothetical protein n=1 Tax=Streptococcus pluranimalium TaxID=82348 RepID=UPI0039FCA877
MTLYISITFFHGDFSYHFKTEGYVSEVAEALTGRSEYIASLSIGEKRIQESYVEVELSDIASYLDSMSHYCFYLELSQKAKQ